jgi:hypothetical protein
MVMTFAPAYPTLPLQVCESAVIDALPGEPGESVICVCGNDLSSDGFSAAGPDGRLSNLMLEPEPELTTEFGFSVCNACGRVYDDSYLTAGGGVSVPAVAHYDIEHTLYVEARSLYSRHNLGEHAA